MLTIAQIIAQMPDAITKRLTPATDALAPLLKEIYAGKGTTPRAIVITMDERGWSVVADGVPDPTLRNWQAGSRGGWPTMRHALLAALLIAECPELSIWGA